MSMDVFEKRRIYCIPYFSVVPESNKITVTDPFESSRLSNPNGLSSLSLWMWIFEQREWERFKRLSFERNSFSFKFPITKKYEDTTLTSYPHVTNDDPFQITVPVHMFLQIARKQRVRSEKQEIIEINSFLKQKTFTLKFLFTFIRRWFWSALQDYHEEKYLKYHRFVDFNKTSKQDKHNTEECSEVEKRTNQILESNLKSKRYRIRSVTSAGYRKDGFRACILYIMWNEEFSSTCDATHHDSLHENRTGQNVSNYPQRNIERFLRYVTALKWNIFQYDLLLRSSIWHQMCWNESRIALDIFSSTWRWTIASPNRISSL